MWLLLIIAMLNKHVEAMNKLGSFFKYEDSPEMMIDDIVNCSSNQETLPVRLINQEMMRRSGK